MTGPHRVFVAHASADAEVAETLLSLSGHLLAWELVRIPSSPDWWSMAEEEIARCDAFVFVDTKAARESTWCSRELAAALEHGRLVIRVTEGELLDLGAILGAAGAHL